uniref:ATP synthase subunit a n=1 Tax=Parevania sp. ZJUH_2016024 TaxID=2491165 RepID=A0A3Q8UAB1_9HYME|nr:ATP synthase F0 subunit 6 [Parevania sp. ZJUH_2016024]
MLNLFSSFNPSSMPLISLNWLSLGLFTLFLPFSFWLTHNKYHSSFFLLLNFLIHELKIILKFKMNFLNLIFLISIFIFILLNNFLSLFPFIFSSSSHLLFSLSLSLMLFIIFMLFGWMMNYNSMFTHLVPLSTPIILIPFMIIIELISNIIRPLTLAIRLSANMIAGHLLITLINSSMLESKLMFISILIIPQMILMFLELNVSFIQSYVFTILSTLYSKEIK